MDNSWLYIGPIVRVGIVAEFHSLLSNSALVIEIIIFASIVSDRLTDGASCGSIARAFSMTKVMTGDDQRQWWVDRALRYRGFVGLHFRFTQPTATAEPSALHSIVNPPHHRMQLNLDADQLRIELTADRIQAACPANEG